MKAGFRQLCIAVLVATCPAACSHEPSTMQAGSSLAEASSEELNYISGCAFDSGLDALTGCVVARQQIGTIEEIHATYTITYNYACSRSARGSSIVVRSINEPTKKVPINFGAATAQLDSSSGIEIYDENPENTARHLHNPSGCSLTLSTRRAPTAEQIRQWTTEVSDVTTIANANMALYTTGKKVLKWYNQYIINPTGTAATLQGYIAALRLEGTDSSIDLADALQPILDDGAALDLTQYTDAKKALESCKERLEKLRALQEKWSQAVTAAQAQLYDEITAALR